MILLTKIIVLDKTNRMISRLNQHLHSFQKDEKNKGYYNYPFPIDNAKWNIVELE